ncbi:MAG: TRAP transporter large permease subunit [Rhodospirillaceae bacterium]|jgi:tripartite ATP-independent transporter DctM subunit|nr:TRAP transporter large permease subunit [Rhodospirillaceae bacterium]MBT6137485.1 TRAP transporter large permease subunit [Rhodospirillaceae bacterium]
MYDIQTATFLIVGSMILLMMFGIPLGVVTLTVSIGTALAYFGIPGLFLVASNAQGLLEAYPLVAVPLFVLMANILERSGVAEDMFDAMSIIAGKLRGGVAVQTTLVAVLMAAMTGIMGGEIVMLGLIALPQMLRLGYDKKLAMGTICAGGSLATLIPPSVIMIIYGLTANISISELFLGGFLPGFLLASLYITYILIRCHLQPHLAPFGADELIQMNAKDKSAKMKGLILPGLLIIWVLGSIYGGIATVTEAAAVGVFGAMIASLARRKLTWEMLQEALRKTMITVGTIIWLVLGAVSFVGIYNVIGGNEFVQGLLEGLNLPPLGVIFVIMGILIVLGTFMEWIAIAYITVPIFAPVVVGLGFDPIWFGVLFVMNIQIYFLSPPFGPACFWLKSVAPPDITLQEIFLAVLPFIGLQIIGLTLVIVFPEIVTFLPDLLGN